MGGNNKPNTSTQQQGNTEISTTTAPQEPKFYNGFWYYEKEGDKKSRIVTSNANVGDVVHARFRGIHVQQPSEFKITIKEYNPEKEKQHEKLLAEKVTTVKKVDYDEKIDGKKIMDDELIFEFDVELKKDVYQKDGNEMVLYYEIETNDKYKNNKPVIAKLPEKPRGNEVKYFLNVCPPVKVVKLCVKVIDSRKGTAVANKEIDRIVIRNGSGGNDGFIWCFEPSNKPVDVKDEIYSGKLCLQALDCFYVSTVVAGRTTFKKLYETGELDRKKNTIYPDVFGKKQIAAYNNYLQDRGYKKNGNEGTILAMSDKNKMPPLSVRRVIVDEYNGMSRTDSNGILYIHIPVEKYANSKKLKIGLMIGGAPALIEKTNKDLRSSPVMREFEKVSTGIFSSRKEPKNTVFKLRWDKTSKLLPSRNPELESLEKYMGKPYTGWVLDDAKGNTSPFPIMAAFIINSEQKQIEDYLDMDKKEKDYSIFFTPIEGNRKRKWDIQNYPLNKPREGGVHFNALMLNYWGNEEQAQYWKEEIIRIGKIKNPPSGYVFNDNELNIIGIRKYTPSIPFKDITGDDVFIVILKGRILGIWQGSTEPGVKTGEYIAPKTRYAWCLKEGQYIGWERTHADLGGNHNDKLNPDQSVGVPASSDGDASGHIESYEHAQQKYGIMFHYGGSGEGKIRSYSEGCQVICGRGYINDAGIYRTGYDVTSNYEQKWTVSYGERKQGAYEAFADTWRSELNKNIGIIYTIINEKDIDDLDRYYNYYRRGLKI